MSFFSVLIVLSCDVNIFVKERLFILMIFTLIYGENLGKNPETPGATSILPALYLNLFYIVAGTSTPNSMFRVLLLPWQQIYHLAFLFNFLLQKPTWN